MYYINKPVMTGHWSYHFKTSELVFSDTVFDILGVKRDEKSVTPENFTEFIHPGDWTFFREEFDKSKKSDTNVEFVHRIVCPDGTIKTVFEQASVIYKNGERISIIGTISDISKQKESEISGEFFSNIYPEVLHSIPTGMFIYRYLEPDQLILLYGNPYAKKLTGLEVSEFIGKEFGEIWPNAKMSGITDSYLKVAKTGEGIELEDIYYTDERVSGAFRIFVFRIAPDKIAVAFQNVTEVLKAEESEKRYSSIVNILPDGVVIHCDGKVEFINDAALKITGYTNPENLLGKPVINFVHPDYRALAIERIKKSLSENTHSGFTEEVFISSDGHPVDVLVAGIPFQYRGKPAMLTVFTDISRLKSTELELIAAKEKAEESEKRFRNSLEFSPIPLAVTGPTGELLFHNKQFKDTFGYEKDDFKTIDDWFNRSFPDETYRDFVKKDWEEVIDYALKNNSTTPEREYNVTCKNGEVKIVEVSMYYEKDIFIGLFQDITERKRTEQEIKDNHELVALFIKMSPIYAYIKQVSPHESKVLYASENYIDMIGVTGTNMVGKTMEELFPYDFARKISEDDWSVVSEGRILTIEEDLNDRNYITIKFPIHQGGRSLLAGYTIDITQLKKTEQELKTAKEKAEESDRLKTAFLQNMSHEIRTPMNAIVGFTALLEQPGVTDEKRKNFTKIINDATNQLLSIIDDILSISSIETNQETVNIEKVSINEIIVNLLTIFKPQAFSQNVSLYSKKQLADKQSVVYTDKTKLTQILSNLITNALKFTHEGFIEFGYNIKGDFIEFYVKDTGIGIKENMRERIFERFLQANENINKKYGGTGLGLAISKAYTELLGGSIRVESELEKGSVFYFTIPYQAVYPEEALNPVETILASTKTIVVAEDEEFNFLFLEELLTGPDRTIIHAKDGGEAIRVCQTNPKIDLVLMDIKMPGMDGHEAAIKIKKLFPQLPIIAQSAYALEHEREKYFGKCFDDYITKPIDADKLRLVVTKYLG